MGLSLSEAAARAGILAPSFLHHIEHGERIPSEEVAARLALALGDDEELYRAWSRLRGGAGLSAALAAAHTIERHLGAAPGPSREGSVAVEPTPAALLRVPRLPWGADPGTLAEPSRDAAEILRFDPAALPREAWLRPFAYRLEGDSIGLFVTGDLVLVTRNAWPIQSTAIYVVRSPRGIELSRVAWRDGTLWMGGPPDPGQPLAPSGTPPRALLGRVAAVIRTGSGLREGR